MDLADAIASLPPGTDVYAFVEQQMDKNIFPQLHKAFWVQAYFVVGISAVIVPVFVAGYVLKARAGKLQLVLHDGAATRLHYINIIPMLYIANALSLICFTFTVRRDILHKHWTQDTGRYWFLAWLPLVLSFTMISHSAIASAPPVRKALARIERPWSLVYLNGGLFFAMSLVTVAIFVAAISIGKVYPELQSVYDVCTALVQSAREANDVQMLAGTEQPLLDLANGNTKILNWLRIGGMIYSVNLVVAFVTGGTMTFILTSVVTKRIERLDLNASSSSSSSWSTSASTDATPTIIIPALSASDFPPSTSHSDVELANRITSKPKPDVPFSNIVKTPTLPERFQAVLQSDATPQEKAKQLREVLKHDHRAMLVYMFCVVIFLVGTLLMAADGERSFDINALVIYNYTYFSWAFLIPGCLAAINFLRDAMCVPSTAPSARSKKAAPAQPFIGVCQTFSVSEDTSDMHQEEKKLRF